MVHNVVRSFISIILSTVISSTTVVVDMPIVASHQRVIDVNILHRDGMKYLFIGDSRHVGMSMCVNEDDNVSFFCRVGAGYDWLCKNRSSIEDLIDSNTVVVVGLGVNDLWNIEEYCGIADWGEFSGCRGLYFLSVNPVDEDLEKEYGYSIESEDIEDFNDRLSEVYGDTYLDTYSWLEFEAGFSTKDGVHYTDNTYTNLYKHIMLELKEVEE